MKQVTKYTLILFVLLFLSGVFSHEYSKNSKQNKNYSTPILISKNIPAGPSKVIYLTMDMDLSEWMYQRHVKGKMSDWYDPNLFTYLMQNKIPVTFFVSGLFAQTYPGLIDELNSTGNYSFENHSYDESSFTPDCYGLESLSTDSEKINQVLETQKIITSLTGQIPTQFRFPGDCHSPADDQLIKNLGLTINSGTIIAGDPFNLNTTAIVNTIMSQAKDNSIILMHIGGHDAPKSLEVLEQIVPALEKKGFLFEKMN